MNAEQQANYFPFTKGAILVVGIVLFFATIMLAVYLWYAQRIAQIDQTLQQLN